ncbi:putative baseplate assembly protein [Ensifer sp.]|jgi:predicted phage baseplate assembly protein|uniref:putative baseplate assembly protein n=1 Tax=Ensifer sp. TaxID=1872086 RepID=UPI002E0DD77C|nr:putative baseplate assembly protein [Ensifer sp.]
MDEEEFIILWRIARILSAETVSRSDYLVSAKVTRLDLEAVDGETFDLNYQRTTDIKRSTRVLGRIAVVAQSEPLALAADELEEDVSGGEIELDGLFDGLDSGRTVIVSGERADVRDLGGNLVPGIRAVEQATIARVEHAANKDAPLDTPHTTLFLATPLTYAYRRATCVIHGNIARASNGETVTETLGSGDASKPFARFSFSRGPLTFLSAETESGAVSSETVRVNDVSSPKAESLLDVDAASRAYTLDVDGTGVATVRFGDGVHGARLPTGPDNIRATYRVGIGRTGNVKAGQISLLQTKPLGVRAVHNPLAASGGADRDGIERIRSNAPLSVGSFGRLVSVADYADFARVFAGIGMADARRFSTGGMDFVHVTVAGVDDVALDPAGDLLANLSDAFDRFGNPAFPVEIAVRELLVMVIEARVAIDPDRLWDKVEPELRRKLLDAFSFNRRTLGAPVSSSAALAVMQTTPGVAAVSIETFGAIKESDLRDRDALAAAVKQLGRAGFIPAAAARLRDPDVVKPGESLIAPAQLAVLLPQAPFALILNRVEAGALADAAR